MFDCPDCFWEHCEIDFQFYKKTNDEIETISDEEYKKLTYEESLNYYPKRNTTNYYYDNEYFEQEWDEIHFCPNCRKEFKFRNGKRQKLPKGEIK